MPDNKTKSNLPPFFNYKEEATDNGYETLQDFILSWTLRCAPEEYARVNEILHSYAKKVLLALVFGENNKKSEIKILSVKTKRQRHFIDLIIEIALEEKGKLNYYVLNIENKWYSPIRRGQLEKSKNLIKQDYNDNKYKIINAIIFCDHEKLNIDIQQFCKENEYKVVVIEDLFYAAEMDNNRLTGNYLFDEYWFNF